MNRQSHISSVQVFEHGHFFTINFKTYVLSRQLADYCQLPRFSVMLDSIEMESNKTKKDGTYKKRTIYAGNKFFMKARLFPMISDDFISNIIIKGHKEVIRNLEETR